MMGTNKKMGLEEKKRLMKQHDQERDIFENANLGGYE
jgi:ribosomal protein L39E